MADHIAWGAAESGSLSGYTVALSGSRLDLGAAAPTRTFADAAADNTNPFGDASTTEANLVVDNDNWRRYEGALWTAAGNTLSLQNATLKAAQGVVPDGGVSVYAQIFESDAKGSAEAVQNNLDTHEANLANPHAVTAVQAGADPAGSAATVQNNLDTHEANLANPHAVTAVQAGADPAGSAATVQNNLDTHEANLVNPHSVTAAQAGADPAGSAAAVQVNLDAHESAASPHSGHLIEVRAGANIAVDNTDSQRPIVSATGTGIPADVLLDGYKETIEAAPATSGTITIPGDASRVYDIALTGNATLALGAGPGASEATIQTLRITHSGGPHTLALPAGVEWVDGTEIAIGGAGTSTVYKISRFGTATAILEGAVASTP